MKEFLLSAINLLPNVIITIIIAYFYAQKKIPALLAMLIAYITITLINVTSIYGVRYFQERAMTMQEIQGIYQIIGIVSIVAHLLFAVALAMVLSNYPDKRDKQTTTFL